MFDILKTAAPSISSASSDATAAAGGLVIAAIVGLVVGIIGSVLVFVLFLNKNNENKYEGFVKWLYNFLQFNRLCIEGILKFTYIFLAIFLTVASFGLISTSFWAFLIVLLVGNLLLRVTYELTMLQILIHRNVRELNEKTK